ncbi:MAG: ParB/RepB/Spo0J family partition protein [Lachnospiraceae bacterium]|nr:ParB/RepB/Spo0J family partition protein [Lachnospiraceae bacterium]
MARKGGLGRGLDALIPDRSGKKKSEDFAKKQREEVQEEVTEETSEEETSEEEEDAFNPFELVLNDSDSPDEEEDLEEEELLEKEAGEEDDDFEASEEENISFGEDNQNNSEENGVPSRDTAFPDSHGEQAESDDISHAPSYEEIETGKQKTDSPASDRQSSEEPGQESVVSMKISMVEPNKDQPRKYFDDAAIEELADSIGKFGIISPLLVQKKDGYYEIIAGERRWRAAQKAGLREIPVIIKDFTSQEAVEVSLIENIQREDLNPIEEAKAYDRLLSEYGLNQEEIAGRVSKSRSAVANSMRLLKLDLEIQRMVEMGSLTEGHARALLGISDPQLQKEAAQQVINNKLSVRQTEKLVKDLAKKPTVSRKKEKDAEKEAELSRFAESLKTTLGTKVSIRESGKNKGKIEIEYYSNDELERIYALLQSVR